MALPVNRSLDEIVVSGRVADVSAVTPGYVVAPVKGKLRRAYSVTSGGTTNGTAVMSFAIDGGSALTDTLSITSGDAAGTVDSVEFSQVEGTLHLCNVNEGSVISITSDGTGSTAVVGTFFLVIERT